MLAKLDLDDRIANAFETELSSEDLSSLLEEAIAADEAAQIAFDQAKATALDPATRQAEVQKARQVMEDAQFRRDRMTIAATKIEELHKQALSRESASRVQAEYEAAKAERDAIAKELRTTYPELAEKMVALLSRLKANDDRIAAANKSRSGGADWLQSAEVLARPLPDGWRPWDPNQTSPSLLRCQIVSFKPTLPNAYGMAWSRTSLS